MNQQQYDQLTDREKKVRLLADMVRGTTEKEQFGMEKSVSIRLNSKLYPLIRAIADSSNTSMNTLILEMLDISLDILFDNLNEEEIKDIKENASAIHNDWLKERGIR